tara:strand:- start:5053 stop:5898 length:846 start_codon:yes stop_codon:yes gene_type:complete
MKKHLSGIIPVSGIKTDFKMPWHESLMPLGPNYLAVERSVAECAYAGCDTIWIVCADDTTPLIRYQVGEKIQDPVYSYRHFEINKGDVKKPIRIYYVPLAIKDINKRDNLAWSAIFGAQTAHKILGALSSHLAPEKFYISWPYGYYHPWLLREHRKDFLETNIVLENEGATVKDNKYLGLTLNTQQIKFLVEESVSTSSGLWNENRDKRLSPQERYSYKNFGLSEVFKGLDILNYKKIIIENYHSIDCWEEYCNFLSIYKEIRKPSILKYSEWSEVGIDDL